MTFVTAKPVRRRKQVYTNGLDRLFDDFFRFDSSTGTRSTATAKHPAVNILEREKDFQLEFAVPGWEKSDFHIQVDKDILTVKAEVKKAEETEGTEEKEVSYRRREFQPGSFKRSFQIPETVNIEVIDAKYSNGILTLTLPKTEEEEANLVRTIEIG